jgi:hypothetical protein
MNYLVHEEVEQEEAGETEGAILRSYSEVHPNGRRPAGGGGLDG